MVSRMDEARPRGAKITALHDRVAQLYYSHGLFCSTYPISVIFFAISVALFCCYPLLNLPLSGNLAMRIWAAGPNGTVGNQQSAAEQPWCYIQQVVVRTAVIPWSDSLNLGDAFRAPLYEAFKLLDIVRNYEDANSSKTLGHVCLHVESIKKPKAGKENILPEYSCLVLSPANLWKQDVQQFSQDTSILNTVFNYQSLQKGKTSLAEILFGMHLTDTGIKRYPLRNRQRIIQYAITLFLKEYDEPFISGLRYKLQTIYPLHHDLNSTVHTAQHILNETVLIHYPGDINYYEFIPLIITYILLFLYYYFSVRKIEIIKSKVGMAFTVLFTVLCSLCMTLGVCFFFGLTLCLQGKEIFPYLVILVGLENVLVLTKSVVTTPDHLDIKIRVAQGLSKEGWSTTKNLLIEITILTIGIFTFVPVIQEFCIFAIVGLINDFFLQMLFFSTILGIDTRRMESLVVDRNNPSFRSNLYQTHNYEKYTAAGMSRSKSHPRLSASMGNAGAGGMHTNVVAGQTQAVPEKKIPKRLRLVNIWARTRFFQRAFMILMVTWIAIILYNSGIIEHLLNEHNGDTTHPDHHLSNKTSFDVLPVLNSGQSNYLVNYVTQKTSSDDADYHHNNSRDLLKLRHADFSAPWMKLSTQHWPAILHRYNVSVTGRSVAVLPNIRLSHAVSPEQAALLRNPDEKYGQKFQWQALAAALDPIDFTDAESSDTSLHHPTAQHSAERPFYPTSPMELLLTAILCAISVIVLAYALVVMYKCICTRNYAEWRASWMTSRGSRGRSSRVRSDGDEEEEVGDESDVPVLLEALPVVLDGRGQQVECLASDGFSVVSACLAGEMRVWDSGSGELVVHIDRNRFFSANDPNHKSPEPSVDCFDDGNTCSDYESGSPPSRDECYTASMFPSLKSRINTNFLNLTLSPNTPSTVTRRNTTTTTTRYDFDQQYHQLYESQDVVESRVRHRNSDTSKWLRDMDECTVPSAATEGARSGVSPAININGVRGGGSSRRNSSCGNSGGGVVSGAQRAPPIWCMDCIDNLIVVGCANGRLEFWEGTTGKFKCLVEDESDVGITSVKIVGSRVIAARLSGVLDFLQLQTYNQGRIIDWKFTSAIRRTHIRTGSAGSISDMRNIQGDCKEDMRCVKVVTTRAHQQPITCLECEGGNVLTGSSDHTLKVFRLDDGTPKYTLHGHCGPITCLFIDRVCPATSGSGSQDGMLCVWDLLTGACMYSVQAHDGSVTALTYSASYVISLGSDERVCIWERFQGHLLNTILPLPAFLSPLHPSAQSHSPNPTNNNNTSNNSSNISPSGFTAPLLMLTPHLLVTAQADGWLTLWDVRTGDSVRSIELGRVPYVYVRQLVLVRDAVLCDYGAQLRLVRFPLITHKYD